MLSALEEELRGGYSQVGYQPKIYQVVEDDVRGAPLHRFPYTMYYRQVEDWIEVVAIIHQARDPRTWSKQDRHQGTEDRS